MTDEKTYDGTTSKDKPGVYAAVGFIAQYSLLQAVNSLKIRNHYAYFNPDNGLYEDDELPYSRYEQSGFGDPTYVITILKTKLVDEDIPLDYQFALNFKLLLPNFAVPYYFAPDANHRYIVDKMGLQLCRDTGRTPKFYIPLKEGIVVMADDSMEVQLINNPATNQRKFVVMAIRPKCIYIQKTITA